MMEQILIETIKQFISIESTDDNKAKLNEVIQYAIKNLPDFTIEQFNKNQHPSILAYFGKKRPNKFKIIFNAHLDVVTAKKNQFQPYIKNSRLYGRGAIDMKAAAVVELFVFAKYAKKLPYPIGLQLVTDEEIGGSDGTRHQIEQGVNADFIIAGESTNLTINNEAKGVVWLKIKVKGRSSHSAYLWQGDNALLKLNIILDRFFKVYPVPKKETWRTTVNLARIETENTTFNKVPDSACAWIDLRYIPKDEKTIIRTLNKIMASDGSIERIEKEPAHYTKKENSYIRQLAEIFNKTMGHETAIISKHGASDIRHYNRVGTDGITFGPVGQGLHSDEEWVDVASLFQYYQILERFVLSI